MYLNIIFAFILSNLINENVERVPTQKNAAELKSLMSKQI